MRRSIILYLFLIASCLYAQNGVIRTFYPDGTPRTAITYVSDVLDGSAFWYYPNGNIETEKYFSNGILNGAVKEFYQSGLIKIEYTVVNGSELYSVAGSIFSGQQAAGII